VIMNSSRGQSEEIGFYCIQGEKEEFDNSLIGVYLWLSQFSDCGYCA
jgi:hypothetical protein